MNENNLKDIEKQIEGKGFENEWSGTSDDVKMSPGKKMLIISIVSFIGFITTIVASIYIDYKVNGNSSLYMKMVAKSEEIAVSEYNDTVLLEEKKMPMTNKYNLLEDDVLLFEYDEGFNSARSEFVKCFNDAWQQGLNSKCDIFTCLDVQIQENHQEKLTYADDLKDDSLCWTYNEEFEMSELDEAESKKYKDFMNTLCDDLINHIDEIISYSDKNGYMQSVDKYCLSLGSVPESIYSDSVKEMYINLTDSAMAENSNDGFGNDVYLRVNVEDDVITGCYISVYQYFENGWCVYTSFNMDF